MFQATLKLLESCRCVVWYNEEDSSQVLISCTLLQVEYGSSAGISNFLGANDWITSHDRHRHGDIDKGYSIETV